MTRKKLLFFRLKKATFHSSSFPMNKFRLIFLATALTVSISGCNQFYQPKSVQYADYGISSQLQSDSSIVRLLKPYSDSVNQRMNDTVAEVATKLEKKRPESTLGNFVADACLFMARQKFNPKAEVAFINYGGLRINAVYEGPLRRATVYEIMPFDNVMVMVPIKGNLLKQYLDGIAKEGGGGVAGISMVMRNKVAEQIKINGQPLDEETTYLMINSDYSSRGPIFENIEILQTTYLIREAILDYCAWHKNQGKKISVLPENRLSNAN
jgi:2',3'-cyclic-nucleotide 2'-phosphodiesterase (5'-nucleotidase family)